MSSDNENMTYTAQDIQKYFSGKLTLEQMHQMEKAALDDPFLTEAMEGYETMNDREWEKQLAQARIQMAQAGTLAKVVPLRRSTGRWWKAAAAILVIGFGTVLTFILTKDKTEDKTVMPQIAKADNTNNTIIIPAPVMKDITTISPAGESATPVSPSVGEQKRKEANSNITQADSQPKPDDNFIYKPGKTQTTDSVKQGLDGFGYTVNKNAGIVTPSASIPSAANSNVQAMETTAANNKEVALNETAGELLKRKKANTVNKNEKPVSNFFNAQVVTSDNSPLPFSNISVKSGRFETYADVKGNFRLFSNDSLLTVEIKSIGYEPRIYSLKSTQSINKIILLENEQAIKDKMDTRKADAGFRSLSGRASVFGDSAINNVEPKDGWDNYNTYVANNLEVPEKMLKNEFHGEVVISFDVKANGSISNIRVNKSLGPAYDEAAKQLIIKGPQWKVKKGNKSSASVKVKF